MVEKGCVLYETCWTKSIWGPFQIARASMQEKQHPWRKNPTFGTPIHSSPTHITYETARDVWEKIHFGRPTGVLIEPHGFCLENGNLGESWEPQSSKKNTTVSTIIRILDVPEKQPMGVLGTSIQQKKHNSLSYNQNFWCARRATYGGVGNLNLSKKTTASAMAAKEPSI